MKTSSYIGYLIKEMFGWQLFKVMHGTILVMGLLYASSLPLLAQRIVIEGRVIEKNCKNDCGIRGAYITAPKAIPCLTDGNGEFKMTVVSPYGKNLSLSIKKPGYTASHSKDLKTIIQPNSNPMEIFMHKKMAIERTVTKYKGRILDQSGNPLEGVIVSERSDLFEKCTTDSDGYFYFVPRAKRGKLLSIELNYRGRLYPWFPELKEQGISGYILNINY